MYWFTEAGLVIETTTGSRVAIVAALVVFAVTTLWRAHRATLSLSRVIVAAAAAMVGAWFGGAILGPIVFGEPGYSSLAAAALAAPMGLVAAAAAGLPARHVADLFAPPALLATAVARVGCLFQGCDYGAPAAVPWAVRHRLGTRAFAWQRDSSLVGDFARLTEPVHPFALYEALPLLAAAVVLWRLPAGRGRVAWAAATAWAIARGVAELFRAEPIPVGPVTLAAVLLTLAAGLAATGAYHLWRTREPAA